MNITEHEMRGLLNGKCLPGDMRVNEELPAYLVRKFTELKAEKDALAAELIPEGYVLVPQQMHLSADAMESLCFHCGDGGFAFGDFTDGILWVGDIENDDGTKTYGLNIATAEYPEEGSANVSEFAAQLRAGKDGE